MPDHIMPYRAEPSAGGLDYFRLLAAFLVVAIHISPLSAVSPDADFFLTRILARLAVPFFFLVTGYFILGEDPKPGVRAAVLPPRVRRFLFRACLLYLCSILLYLPFGLYAGHYKELAAGMALRMVLFDGTFYHLWYFPACILGVLLVSLMKGCLPRRAVALTVSFLYLAGLFGDSYYGLAASVPFLKTAYEGIFGISSYTRNGLFFAPLFLALGSWLSARPDRLRSWDKTKELLGFFVSFALMALEGFLLRYFKLPRHDSMYLFLVPAVFFLFRFLLSLNCPPSKTIRTASAWIYILHPAVLIILRMTAKPLGLTKILVENPLIQFLSVSAVTAAAAFFITAVLRKEFFHAKFHAGTGLQTRPPASAFACDPPEPVSESDGQSSKASSPSSTYLPGKRAWIELDLEALRHNVEYLRGLLPKGCRLMPAVKANAYGHGAVPIARELNRLGVDAFCVACVSEGVNLRKHGITGEILILGYTHPTQFPLLPRYQLTQTVVDANYAACLNEFGQRLHVHVGIDTGMHRLGERSENLKQLQSIWQMEHLVIDGVFTHLCTADGYTEQETAYLENQASAFYRTVNHLKKLGLACPRLHLLSSYGLLRCSELSEDYVRTGIALYGVLSDGGDMAARNPPLEPVLSLKARIAAVKKLLPGESAGYGIAYTAGQERTLAILAIGYADGLPRSFSCGKGSVLINGQKAPIVGRICMDQAIVDTTGIPGVKAGGYAVLIGSSYREQITVYDWAETAGTITNEILSRLGGRLERLCIHKSPASHPLSPAGR